MPCPVEGWQLFCGATCLHSCLRADRDKDCVFPVPLPATRNCFHGGAARRTGRGAASPAPLPPRRPRVAGISAVSAPGKAPPDSPFTKVEWLKQRSGLKPCPTPATTARTTGIGPHHITVGIDTTSFACIAGQAKKNRSRSPGQRHPPRDVFPINKLQGAAAAHRQGAPDSIQSEAVSISGQLMVCRCFCEIFPTQLIKNYCIQSYKQQLTEYHISFT